jgi:hypothetical protein
MKNPDNMTIDVHSHFFPESFLRLMMEERLLTVRLRRNGAWHPPCHRGCACSETLLSPPKCASERGFSTRYVRKNGGTDYEQRGVVRFITCI